MPALRPMLAAAIAGLIIAACGPAAAQELRSHVPRASADPAAAQDVRAAMDAFSADLYRVLAREQGNVILSPFSVEVALAMTRAGAVGETALQMDKVLHAALAKDLSAGFNAIDQALAKRPGKYKVGDQTLDLELGTATGSGARRTSVSKRHSWTRSRGTTAPECRSSTTRPRMKPLAARSTTGSRHARETASRTSSRRA